MPYFMRLLDMFMHRVLLDIWHKKRKWRAMPLHGLKLMLHTTTKNHRCHRSSSELMVSFLIILCMQDSHVPVYPGNKQYVGGSTHVMCGGCCCFWWVCGRHTRVQPIDSTIGWRFGTTVSWKTCLRTFRALLTLSWFGGLCGMSMSTSKQDGRGIDACSTHDAT